MKKQIGAALMSVALAASMSLNVFAGTSSSTTNTIIPTQATETQKEEAATQILEDETTAAVVESKLPTTTTTVTNEQGQTQEVTQIDTNRASTAEAIGKTEGTTFYILDQYGRAQEIAQNDISYNLLSGNLSRRDQQVAQRDRGYIGTVSFATTNLFGRLVASIVTAGTRGFSPAYNTLNVWKIIGNDLTRRGISYAQFAANPSIYKIKAVQGNRLVDTDLIRWVVINGRAVLVVNYRAFSSRGYAVVVDTAATYGSTADSVAADVTGTATNPNMSPDL